MFALDVKEDKRVGKVLNAQTPLHELETGKKMHIEDYTFLFEYETETENGTAQYCAVGLVDTESGEIRKILSIEASYSTMDIGNIGKHERVLSTDIELFHAPFVGKLAAEPEDGAVKKELREGLKAQGMSDEEIDAKCLQYSLSKAEPTGKIHRMLYLKSVTIIMSIVFFLMALGAAVTGYLHVKWSRERQKMFKEKFSSGQSNDVY
jgi:hypothetical protein